MIHSSKNIRIGIDCRDIFIAKTGSKTYLSELIAASEKHKDDEIDFVKLFPIFPVLKPRGAIGKVLKHIQFFIWKQLSLPIMAKFKRCDLLICTDYFLPSFKWGIKHIVVFHDAFFWEYPQHYNRFWLNLFHKWAVPAAKNAEQIIVPSNYAKQRLSYFMKHDPDKFAVIYEAPKSLSVKKDRINSVFDIADASPYLLHVGALSKHKNLPALIHAFKQATSISNENWHLLLIGGSGTSNADDDSWMIEKAIQETGLHNQVHLLGYVGDEDLSFYYTHASGYVFPSYNEGFGLPLLEAMKFKLPVAAANNTCLSEIGKNAAIYFDPHNINDMSLAIGKIINKDQEILDTISQQPIVLSMYSWDKAVLEIISIFKEHN